MRIISRYLAAILFAIVLPLWVSSQTLIDFLKSQPEIKSVIPITGNNFFNDTYEIMIRQPVDHKDTTVGFFLQRVVIADKGIDNPVVVITEGYNSNYATKSRYINELSPILNANQICIEHRYFGKSVPSPLNWDYLTVANAVTDHHRIIQLFKKYYHSKWVSTGISKGGQTAMSHRESFPDDVDVTVEYVGPINFAVEDGRHKRFIAHKAGTAKQRKAIFDFQIEVLKRREQMIPLLKIYSEKNNYTYRMPLSEVLDFCVLEFSFSFWQWAHKTTEIPSLTSDDEKIFAYLMKVASSNYFSEEGIEPTRPFFVQAAKELGYYAYDTRKFKKYLAIKNAKNYLQHIFLPEGLYPKFNKKTMVDLDKFIHETDAKMVFIYGENDPWSASAASVPKKDNLIKIVQKEGGHRTRINTLPETEKEKIIATLKNWLL